MWILELILQRLQWLLQYLLELKFCLGCHSPSARENRNYLTANNNSKDILLWSSNLNCTVNYSKFTSIVRYMVKLPNHLRSMLGGLLISDAWLQINKSGNTRFFFKQS